MPRVTVAVLALLLTVSLTPGARAQTAGSATASAAAPAPTAPAAASQPASPPAGVAVLALSGASDVAWPLAQAVYAAPSLRPAALEEPRARVLCGEPPAAGAPPDLRDLSDTVAAVHGDDAPSRAMLGEIAHRLNVRDVVVVHVDAGQASARVFLADTGAFDAATYSPDAGPAVSWSGAVRSLARTYGNEPATVAPAPVHAPLLATHEEPLVENAPPKKRAFYESGWFWGAIGAAAFAGGALFFATRDNGPTTIHLQAEVPH